MRASITRAGMLLYTVPRPLGGKCAAAIMPYSCQVGIREQLFLSLFKSFERMVLMWIYD